MCYWVLLIFIAPVTFCLNKIPLSAGFIADVSFGCILTMRMLMLIIKNNDYYHQHQHHLHHQPFFIVVNVVAELAVVVVVVVVVDFFLLSSVFFFVARILFNLRSFPLYCFRIFLICELSTSTSSLLLPYFHFKIYNLAYGAGAGVCAPVVFSMVPYLPFLRKNTNIIATAS